MISNPTSKGKRSEARILADLTAAGKSVLIPWGEERFDLVICEEPGTFMRVQVKTGCLKEGYVLFRTVSVCNNGRLRLRYDGQVDAFAVYCPDLDRSYLVPDHGLPSEMATLRVSSTRNGQSSGIRWAQDYAIRTTVSEARVPDWREELRPLRKRQDDLPSGDVAGLGGCMAGGGGNELVAVAAGTGACGGT